MSSQRETQPRALRIGCGAGFWGDSADGPRQLVMQGELDYLVMDYLAEITMSILARLKARDDQAGYATDFIEFVMRPLLNEIVSRGIKVVTNAGGINPLACKAALEALSREAGLTLRVAAVTGDDLSGMVEILRAEGVVEMSTGAALPARPASINAYLGATPIAAALSAGADVVICGRAVDSALVLGPLMHEFGWAENDYDRLAAGSLAGHIIECGTQCTGGLFTDWQNVPGWDDMGFPIAVCRADGTFDITKPAGTGGLVSCATVAEQVVYEIGDPACYRLPDVYADFSTIALTQSGPDCVTVSGARGRAPGTTYKASVTHADGYRATAMMMIGGSEARAKAERVAASILARTRRLFGAAGLADYREISIEVLGSESTYGPHSRARDCREVILKLAVAHADKNALELFTREIFPAATAMAQGLTGFAGGRPTVQPVVRLFSCLVDKRKIAVSVSIGEELRAVPIDSGSERSLSTTPSTVASIPVGQPSTMVPLRALAHARSGDKGDSANIGVLARRSEFVDVLRREVTAPQVAHWLAHLVDGPVVRYEWPGLHGFNFVLDRALGGGGVASLRHDPQGKAYAQMLLDMPVAVPAAWTGPGGILSATP